MKEQNELEDLILERERLLKSVKQLRVDRYYENKEQIDRLNQLNYLQEQANELLKKYNLIKTDDKFSTLEEHFKYLNKNGLYNVMQKDKFYLVSNGTQEMKSNKIIYKFDEWDYSLYHGTSISFAKKILKNGHFKARKDDINIIQYNKIFFSPLFEYAKIYGRIGGAHNHYFLPDDGDKYIVFKCNPKQKYEVYSYIAGKEYAIWGDVSTDIIETIYMCEKDTILKEISREELLNL